MNVSNRRKEMKILGKKSTHTANSERGDEKPMDTNMENHYLKRLHNRDWSIYSQMYKLQSNKSIAFLYVVFIRMQNVKRLMYVPLLLSVFFCSHSLSQCYFFIFLLLLLLTLLFIRCATVCVCVCVCMRACG